MKKKTWCISLLLTLCLLFCSIPVQAASGWNSSWGGGYRSTVILKERQDRYILSFPIGASTV